MALKEHSPERWEQESRPSLFVSEHRRNLPGVLDRLLAILLLLVFGPLMILVAVIVKLEAPGAPVLYKQERVGLNRRRGDRRTAARADDASERDRRRTGGQGRPFRIWKFRTMVPDAESGTGPVWAREGDPRITRVGRILRKTRLDELPQLLNVLRGEMRLIGPRPERPFFVDQLADRVPGYRERLRVPPGITGLAQVERDYDADMDDVKKKLRYDLFYIHHRRPTMDIKILLKTILVMLSRRGSR